MEIAQNIKYYIINKEKNMYNNRKQYKSRRKRTKSYSNYRSKNKSYHAKGHGRAHTRKIPSYGSSRGGIRL